MLDEFDERFDTNGDDKDACERAYTRKQPNDKIEVLIPNKEEPAI